MENHIIQLGVHNILQISLESSFKKKVQGVPQNMTVARRLKDRR